MYGDSMKAFTLSLTPREVPFPAFRREKFEPCVLQGIPAQQRNGTVTMGPMTSAASPYHPPVITDDGRIEDCIFARYSKPPIGVEGEIFRPEDHHYVIGSTELVTHDKSNHLLSGLNPHIIQVKFNYPWMPETNHQRFHFWEGLKSDITTWYRYQGARMDALHGKISLAGSLLFLGEGEGIDILSPTLSPNDRQEFIQFQRAREYYPSDFFPSDIVWRVQILDGQLVVKSHNKLRQEQGAD